VINSFILIKKAERLKILVVDDSMMARNMLIELIPPSVKAKSEIFQAKNGLEGVNLYKEHNPNIVFLDLTMPVMDGFEALALIMEYNPKAFVVVVSADIQPKAIERVLGLGAFKHISKSIDVDQIADAFQEVMLREVE
jgi:two-component system, chemotaxis family, chemotaxis protein CheY